MNQQLILKAVKNIVFDRFRNDPTGHDFWHMARVVKTAKEIAAQENADIFLCELSGWMHDLFDVKLCDDPEKEKEIFITYLHEQGIKEEMITKVFEIIDEISFSGGHQVPSTLEGKIVQDADRLDAIGAIGIARTFAYGGAKGQLLYDPVVTGQDRTSSVQHFYDKLLKLNDLMNTATGKSMANQRHQFMEEFLSQFYREWPNDLELL